MLPWIANVIPSAWWPSSGCLSSLLGWAGSSTCSNWWRSPKFLCRLCKGYTVPDDKRLEAVADRPSDLTPEVPLFKGRPPYWNLVPPALSLALVAALAAASGGLLLFFILTLGGVMAILAVAFLVHVLLLDRRTTYRVTSKRMPRRGGRDSRRKVYIVGRVDCPIKDRVKPRSAREPREMQVEYRLCARPPREVPVQRTRVGLRDRAAGSNCPLNSSVCRRDTGWETIFLQRSGERRPLPETTSHRAVRPAEASVLFSSLTPATTWAAVRT